MNLRTFILIRSEEIVSADRSVVALSHVLEENELLQHEAGKLKLFLGRILVVEEAPKGMPISRTGWEWITPLKEDLDQSLGPSAPQQLN